MLAAASPDSTPLSAPVGQPRFTVQRGRYALSRVVAVGDNSVLFLATDGESAGGEPCVVRMPHAWWLSSGGRAEDWLAPWEQARRSRHPLQLRVHDVGLTRGVPFVAHDWLPGTDLLSLMRAGFVSKRPLPLRFVLAAAVLLAEVATHANRESSLRGAGPVAGRLGPHRLRVGQDGRLLLGSGFAPPHVQASLAVPASPAEYAYRAPETVRCNEITPLTDAWGLCLMLDHGVALWNRFERPDIPGTADALLAAQPGSRSPFLPAALAEWVEAGLAPAAEHRLGIGPELTQVLLRALEGYGGPPSSAEWGAELRARPSPASATGADASYSREAVHALLARFRSDAQPAPGGHPPDRRGSAGRSAGPARDDVAQSSPAGWARAASTARTMAKAILISTIVSSTVLGVATAGVLWTADGSAPTRHDTRVTLTEEAGRTRVVVRSPPLAAPARMTLNGAHVGGESQSIELFFLGVDPPAGGPAWLPTGGAVRQVSVPARVGGFAVRIDCRGRCPTPSRFDSVGGYTELVLPAVPDAPAADPGAVR